MSKPLDNRQKDLLRPALASMINLRHPLAILADKIDWPSFSKELGSIYRAGDGRPPLPVRLMAGLLILKHMHSLSDEALCAAWVENPYFQYFCGEEVFQHQLRFDRSSLTRWRQRLGDEKLAALLQESLRVAHASGALASKDMERVVVDTTVQAKNIAHPTDARLTHKALEQLVEFAKSHGLELRQAYPRVAKKALIMVGRYLHAKQFNRAKRALKFLRIRLSRVIRDIGRKVDGNAELKALFAPLRDKAIRIRHQCPRDGQRHIYAWHAPEVECIGKGKVRTPYEFGCKVSIATPVTQPKGGQFVLHAQALHNNPFDGHTLAGAISDVEKNTGIRVRRAHVDKGYKGHGISKAFVFISGQIRNTTKAIKREMKRRAAVEPIIAHLKAEHRMGRNYLAGMQGDRINPILAAAGFNFHLLLRWFAALLCLFIRLIMDNDPKPVHLVVDGLPAHKTALVKAYVESTNGMLKLHFLPGYAPELNPDELVWSHMKRTGVARTPLRQGEKLREKIKAQLAAIQRTPQLVRSFFQAPSIAYIADW